jgi:hypothetical protein
MDSRKKGQVERTKERRTEIHDMIPADGAVFYDDICGYVRYMKPKVFALVKAYPKPTKRLHSTARGGLGHVDHEDEMTHFLDLESLFAFVLFLALFLCRL